MTKITVETISTLKKQINWLLRDIQITKCSATFEQYKILALIEYFYYMLDEYVRLTIKDEDTYNCIVSMPLMLSRAIMLIRNDNTKEANNIMKQIHRAIWQVGVANISSDFDTFCDFLLDADFTQYSL